MVPLLVMLPPVAVILSPMVSAVSASAGPMVIPLQSQDDSLVRGIGVPGQIRSDVCGHGDIAGTTRGIRVGSYFYGGPSL